MTGGTARRRFFVVEDGLAALEQERVHGDELGHGGALVLQLLLYGTDKNAKSGRCCHRLKELVRT